MFINDVGQELWEEIKDGFAGANYAWPETEGDFDQATFPNFTRPFFANPHAGPTPAGCASQWPKVEFGAKRYTITT